MRKISLSLNSFAEEESAIEWLNAHNLSSRWNIYYGMTLCVLTVKMTGYSESSIVDIEQALSDHLSAEAVMRSLE